MNKDRKIDIASGMVVVFIVMLFLFAGAAKAEQDDWTKLQAKPLPELAKWCFTWKKNWFDDPSAPYCKVGDVWYYEGNNRKARNIVLNKIKEGK